LRAIIFLLEPRPLMRDACKQFFAAFDPINTAGG
jgi:hypothetical protein